MSTDAVIYLDNHSTTRVDPRVVAAVLPWWEQHYGNAGSIHHAFGWEAKDRVDAARRHVAQLLGASDGEIVFTSGATESNNLALHGVVDRELSRGHRPHIVSVVTEHRAVLDPLERCVKQGAEVTLLPVRPHGSPDAGRIDLELLEQSLRDDTRLVSVMWANNEIGTLQPLTEIAAMCQSRGILVHSDATQAVGKVPIDLAQVPVDLMSFSAHKFYGPKGVGALFVRQRRPRVRLLPLLQGGGQEFGLRSGTLNVPGIVGLETALAISLQELPTESLRLAEMRDQLWHELSEQLPQHVWLNGPALHESALRLGGNLNWGVRGILGETLMLQMPGLAISSGSACTAVNPEPSHVLRALGLDEDAARSSLRIGFGRFNQPHEVPQTAELIVAAVEKLSTA